VLIDLHCHTLPLSRCSSLEVDQLVAMAANRGLDGICLTEHDRSWDPALVDEIRARAGILVLTGMELTTDAGHVLAFGLRAYEPAFAQARVAFEAAKEAGAVLYLAHPARDGSLRVGAETVEMFESVEEFNGSDSRLQNLSAGGIARGFRLPGIGGSDAHTAAEVGRAATLFDDRIGDEVDLITALREGRYKAVSLG
jgi:predicted metal-dependent phosphoesterase TrpH